MLATVELAPIADATIYETVNAINTSNGVGHHLIAGVTGENGGFTARRSLIRFDFSSIPSGATIDSAVLELTGSISAPGSGDRDVSLFPLLSGWTEGPSDAPRGEGIGAPSQLNDASWFFSSFPSVSWVLNPGGDFNLALPSATTSVGQPDRYAWSSDDMSADVAGWLSDPDSNFGWIIVGDELDVMTARRFESRENPVEANRPKLTVQYSLPTITGPTSPLNDDQFDITIDFNEPVSGFDASDIQVSGGDVKEVVDSGGGVFVATIDADNDGTVTIDVPAGAATNSNGAETAASNSFSIQIDTLAPTPIISGPFGPLRTQRFDVTIDFDETVQGFVSSDVQVGNGTIEQLIDNGDGTHTASILGNLNSTITVDIAAGVTEDLAGNPNNVATRYSVHIPNPTHDYGDAPSPYPTMDVENGANHFVGNLFLGASIDAELDGIPSVPADSDGDDDDGIAAMTTLVGGADETFASVTVVASMVGRLDGWIDLNRDGDWNDLGEQVFDSLTLNAGPNDLAISVPPGSATGDTYMRLRLSMFGGLQPTGTSFSGEVEDYLLRLEDPSQPYSVSVPLIQSEVSVQVVDGELQVISPSTDQFRSPAANVDALELLGTEGDETITIDLDSFPIPSGGIRLEGRAGINTVRFAGNGSSINFANQRVDASDFEEIDLRDAGDAIVILNAAAVTTLQPQDERVTVLLGAGDLLQFEPSDNWRMIDPIIVDGNFRLVAGHQAGGEQVEVASPRPWQNTVNESDVNNSGDVSAGDALVIINELARRNFSDSEGTLVDPLTVAQWPGIYYDQSGDDRVSALDALRVINRLSTLAESEGERISVMLPQGPQLDSRAIDTGDHHPSTLPVESIDSVMSKIGDFTSLTASHATDGAVPIDADSPADESIEAPKDVTESSVSNVTGNEYYDSAASDS